MPSVRQLIWEDLHASYEGGKSMRKAVNALLFNPAFKAVAWYRIAHACFRQKLVLLAYTITYCCRRKYAIEISPQAIIGRRFRLVHGLGTIIGAGVVIGDDCAVYQGVTFGTGNVKSGDWNFPVLGNAVTVYAGAKIVGALNIGERSIVGANAVVVSSMPADSVVVGVPGRAVRTAGARVSVLDRGDEMGTVLQGLLDRIARLEAQLAATTISGEGHRTS